MKHGKLPFLISSSTLIVTADSKLVASCIPMHIPEISVDLEEAIANAELLTKAANMHHELVAIAEQALRLERGHSQDDGQGMSTTEFERQIEETLAKL